MQQYIISVRELLSVIRLRSYRMILMIKMDRILRRFEVCVSLFADLLSYNLIVLAILPRLSCE